jgi:hypothetical protein
MGLSLLLNGSPNCSELPIKVRSDDMFRNKHNQNKCPPRSLVVPIADNLFPTGPKAARIVEHLFASKLNNQRLDVSRAALC